MVYTFVLSDESINSYGTRVLTAGIDLSNFKNNPIMYWNHSRTWRGTEDEVLPIGKWENIRIEGTKLLADAVFDEDDDFALKIKSKVDKGIINMASAGLRIVATSEDKSVLQKGQTRPTIVQSIMKEASIVDEGSNKGCLRLQDEYGDIINFSEGDDNHLLPLLNNTDMDFRNQVRTKLNLSDNATDAEILAAVGLGSSNEQVVNLQERVNALSTEKTRLEGELQVFKDAEEVASEQKRIALVDNAIKARKITADLKDTYLSLAEQDYEGTEKVLAAMEGVENPAGEGEGAPAADPWDERFREIRELNK